MAKETMNLFPTHKYIRPFEQLAGIKKLRALQHTRRYKKRKSAGQQLDIFLSTDKANKHYLKQVKLRIAQIIGGKG